MVGLGAVGGLIGARLARGGVPVSAVARGATLEAVRRDGLTLIEDGERSAYPIRVSGDPAHLRTPDVVLLSVKATALPAVAPTVAALLGPHTTVVSATNGIPWWFCDGLPLPPPGGAAAIPSADPGGVLRATLPPGQVLGSVLHLSASTPAPGVVEHRFDERIVLGEPTGGTSERAERVAALLRTGFTTQVSDCVQRDVWFKLWGNMTMNPLSAVTGATMDRILDDPELRGFATRCMREAAEVGERIGLHIDVDPEQRHAVTRRLGAARTSMLQDVDAGRPIELDALVTTVIELARSLGVPTPELETLLGLARVHAQVRGLY